MLIFELRAPYMDEFLHGFHGRFPTKDIGEIGFFPGINQTDMQLLPTLETGCGIVSKTSF